MRLRFAVCLTALTLALVSPALAGAPEVIQARIASYRSMGAAFKAVNDALRADAPDLRSIRRSARVIRATAHHQYRWFPAGSGSASGQRTKARPEIWTNAAGFRSAQDSFAAQAGAFARAAGSGDLAAIRAETRKLGGTCKQCHDQFRTTDD